MISYCVSGPERSAEYFSNCGEVRCNFRFFFSTVYCPECVSMPPVVCNMLEHTQGTFGSQTWVWPWRSRKGRPSEEEWGLSATWVCEQLLLDTRALSWGAHVLTAQRSSKPLGGSTGVGSLYPARAGTPEESSCLPSCFTETGVRPSEVMQLSEGRIRIGWGPCFAAATVLGSLVSPRPFRTHGSLVLTKPL